MFRVLRERNFGLLFGGAVVSQTGDYVLFIALPFWVYQLTGSGAATAAMFAALTIPRLLLSPIAGVFADRWDRRATMIGSDLLRAAIVLALLAVRSEEQVWLVFVLAFAESSVSRFFYPARVALLPAIVSRDRLVPANAAMGFSEAAGQLGGPALGGVLLALWGAHGAVVVDALSYLLSAVLIALIRVPARERVQNATRGVRDAVLAVWRELVEGAAVVTGRATLRAVFGVQGAFSLGNGVTNSLVVVLVSRVWDGGSRELGWLITAEGAGALAAGPLVGALAGRTSPRALLAGGSIGLGLVLLVVVNQPSLVVAVGLLALLGAMAVCTMVGMSTLVQLASDDRNLGRVSSLLNTTGAAASLLAAGAAGLLADRIGVVPMFDAAALAFALGGPIALLVPRRSAPTTPPAALASAQAAAD